MVNPVGAHLPTSAGLYEGEFQDGKIQGKGIMTFPEGQRYEGDFVNEKFEGSGMYTWPNGNRYEGQFANGKFEGRGIYTVSYTHLTLPTICSV